MITDGFRETISSLLALKIWKTQIYIAGGKKHKQISYKFIPTSLQYISYIYLQK